MQRALDVDADNPVVNFSIGLLYVRSQQLQKALTYLGRAADLAPETARYSYVHAVALFDSGQREASIAALERNLQRHPGHRETLSALVHYLSALGRSREASTYQRRLQTLSR